MEGKYLFSTIAPSTDDKEKRWTLKGMIIADTPLGECARSLKTSFAAPSYLLVPKQKSES